MTSATMLLTKLRRCSDFGRLGINEESSSQQQQQFNDNFPTTTMITALSNGLEVEINEENDDDDDLSKSFSKINSNLNQIVDKSSEENPKSKDETELPSSPDEYSGGGGKQPSSSTSSNGILKHKTSIKSPSSANNFENSTKNRRRDGSPSPSLIKMNGCVSGNGNSSGGFGGVGGTGVGGGTNKILSFKISRELEELTTNGIRLASNSNRREKNVTYKLGLIMITFIVSWLPFSIMWPLISWCDYCVSASIYIFSFWLAYLNSVFTPIILLYNNAKYRRSFFVFLRIFVLNPFNFVFRRNVFKNGAANHHVNHPNNNNNTFNNNTTNNDNNNNNYMYEFPNSNAYGVENSRASFCRRPSLVNRRRSIKINY